MDASFSLDGDHVVPTAFAVSPRSSEMVSGRHLTGRVADFINSGIIERKQEG